MEISRYSTVDKAWPRGRRYRRKQQEAVPPGLRFSLKIRNRVYRLLLVKTKPLIAVNPDLPRKLQWTTEQHSRYIPRPRKTITTMQCIMIGPPDTQILRIDKQIHGEPRDVLYGENISSVRLDFLKDSSDGVERDRINTLQCATILKIRLEELTDDSFLGWSLPSDYKAALQSAEHDSQSTLVHFLALHPWLEDLEIIFQIDILDCGFLLPPDFWKHVYPLRKILNINNVSLSVECLHHEGLAYQGPQTGPLAHLREAFS